MNQQFNKKTPAILVVDDFYQDPLAIHEFALQQQYVEDLRYYKGQRTAQAHLFPYVKEEFERLLGIQIIDWMAQPMNGVFQLTQANDPIVWHSDSQQYAAAIYLTRENLLIPHEDNMGTSFWRNTELGYRRPPVNQEDANIVYSEYNLTHPDNWSLVDKIGGVFNRLVIWDAKLIHSATQYPSGYNRLAQLFFFTGNK